MKEQKLKKILVIEEEAPVRDQFLSGLRTEGFNAIGASNGRAGLQCAQDHLPDLITCNISLAELDGFAVLRNLRKNSATAIIPLVFVSVKMTRSDLHKAMELGASGYLIKPCTVKELLGTVAAQLERQALLHQHYMTPARPLTERQPVPTAVNAPVLSQSAEAYESPLRETFHFITENYHQPIALSDVAQAVGYSPAYLTHLMGRQTGQTVQQWIIKHRMAAACSLLLETDKSVEQIAVQVGYRHPVHFFRQFRRLYGTTPQVWRNERH